MTTDESYQVHIYSNDQDTVNQINEWLKGTEWVDRAIAYWSPVAPDEKILCINFGMVDKLLYDFSDSIRVRFSPMRSIAKQAPII